MRKFACLAAALAAFSSPARGQDSAMQHVDGVKAVVNDDILTISEVRGDLKVVFEKLAEIHKRPQLDDKINEEVARYTKNWVETHLVVAEALKMGIYVPQKNLEDAYEKEAQKHGGLDGYREFLKRNGSSPEKRKEELKLEAIEDAVFERVTTNAVFVKPSDVRKYYKDNLDKFFVPEQVQARQIVLWKKEFPDAEAAQKAVDQHLTAIAQNEATLKEIAALEKNAGNDPDAPAKIATLRDALEKNGGDFATIARNISQSPDAREGGFLGSVARDTLLPEVEKALFSMTEGEVRHVETPTLHFILKLEKKVVPHTASFEEVKDEVFVRVQAEKRKAVEAEFLAKIRAKNVVQGE